MKKNIKLLIAFLIIAMGAQAQIDRSKMPKSGPTPVINLGEPHSFVLPNGLTVLIVENHKLPRVTLSLTLDTPPVIEGNKAGVSSLVSQIMGKGTTNIGKDAFNEEVDFLGANIGIGVNGGFAQSLSKYAERTIELFADAALHPNFTQEELDLERKKAIEGIKTGEKSAAAIASRVRSVLGYGKKHPAGEYTSEETLNTIKLDDVKSYYRNYFVPTTAYLVVIGDITKDKAQKLVTKYFEPWIRASALDISIPSVQDVQYTQVNFVDVPNAVQTELAVTNISELNITDKDYHAALVANYILGGSFNSYINMNLREEHGYTYGARTSLPFNKNYNTLFRTTTKVRNAVTDSAIVEILKEYKRIRTELVDPTLLKNAKAKFLGDYILASESDRTIADRAIQLKTQNLPKDFFETFIKKIDAVTQEDVKRVANKYFKLNNARIVAVGRGLDILPGLEKLTFDGQKIPIMYFDKYGNRTAKPNFNTEVPKDITAQGVVDTYLKAIGGKDKLATVASTFTTAKASANGAELTLIAKVTSKNQTLTNVLFAGNSVNKNVFDGTKGYAMAQGQKIEFNADQIKEAKENSHPFPELKNKAVAVEGIEPYDNGKAYKVKMSDKKTSFFDTKTGLKTKDVVVQEQGGQKFTTEVNYSNYKDVNGIKFPFTMTISFGPQNIDFNVSEVKINEGVSDEDFK